MPMAGRELFYYLPMLGLFFVQMYVFFGMWSMSIPTYPKNENPKDYIRIAHRRSVQVK